MTLRAHPRRAHPGARGPRARIRHVRLVVGAVGVLPVPAGRERDDRSDAAVAEAARQRLAVGRAAVDVGVVARARHAAVADLGRVARARERRVADQHPEARLERRHRRRPVRRRDVVHRDAAVGAEALARELRDAAVRAVARAEVEHRRPVVGEVLREGAAGAGGLARQVVGRRVHGRVERVAPDDLVQVGRGDGAGGYEGVETVDDELRAAEAHHRHRTLAVPALHEEEEGEGFPLHFGVLVPTVVGEEL